MYGNIIQQEQNRKNAATAADSSNKATKTAGLLDMLKGGKTETVQEKHKKVYG
jgi:hypothetical protein